MSRKIRLLIVDDEDHLRLLLLDRFNRKGYATTGASTAEEALNLAVENVYDVALVDIRLPEMDGLELLTRLKEIQPDMEILMMTGHGTIETAIEAMRRGAYHYLTKPVNLQELEVVTLKAAEKQQLSQRYQGMKTVLERSVGEPVIVGESQGMKTVLNMVQRFAPTDLPILIWGESGTGKELIAKVIHHHSQVKAPMVAINCGALPEGLLESELFGHEKGAFTGAAQARMGLVEAADGTTLFLDEIGEMHLSVQVKLLRFLETGEFRRVGENRLRTVSARVVAATNRNLLEEVQKGNFRRDLYYRLNGVSVRIPALRERPEDILPLVRYFMARRLPGHLPKLSEEAQEALMSYGFPGNVRELLYMVERAVVLHKGSKNSQLTKEDFFPCTCDSEEEVKPKESSPQHDPSTRAYPPGMPLEEVKRAHILATLEAVEGNKSLTAEQLGIGLRSLYRYLEEWGIS